MPQTLPLLTVIINHAARLSLPTIAVWHTKSLIEYSNCDFSWAPLRWYRTRVLLLWAHQCWGETRGSRDGLSVFRPRVPEGSSFIVRTLSICKRAILSAGFVRVSRGKFEFKFLSVTSQSTLPLSYCPSLGTRNHNFKDLKLTR